MEHTYIAEVSWDEEASVWYVSNTDVPSLVAEAESEHELAQKILELVPELYELNRQRFHCPTAHVIPLRMTSSRLESIPLAG